MHRDDCIFAFECHIIFLECMFKVVNNENVGGVFLLRRMPFWHSLAMPD